MKTVAKPILYLLPVYIASLKYYEKLLPGLQEKYNVRFLIVRPNDERRQGMLNYAESRELPYEVLDAGLGHTRLRIPLITAVAKRLAHQAACRRLVGRSPKAKLVAVKAISTFTPLFKEANRQGMDTIVLQSALTPPRGFYRAEPTKQTPQLLYQLYRHLLLPVIFLADLLVQGPSYVRASADPNRVGVIGQEGVRIFKERFGYEESKVAVIGNADYQRVSELCSRVHESVDFRNELLKRYHLQPDKKRILIISVWFEHHGAVRPAHLYSAAEKKAQVAHYLRIIEILRKKCPRDDYDILFKLHPSEKNIYDSCEYLGVRFFGDEALSEELLALSDLYVADPCTSANYMAVASGMPALFVNTTAIPALNKCTLFYPMTRIIQSWEELEEAACKFADGKLSKGYDDSKVDRRSIERIIRFIGT